MSNNFHNNVSAVRISDLLWNPSSIFGQIFGRRVRREGWLMGERITTQHRNEEKSKRDAQVKSNILKARATDRARSC